MELILKNFLKLLPFSLYEYRYIIFSFLYGDFIILKNSKNFRLFFNDNNIIRKSLFFQNKFNDDKYIYKIPENINIKNIYLHFIYSYLTCDNIFYKNFINELKYIEFVELINLLKYFDLIKFDLFNLLKFYLDIINIDYNIENIKNIKIKNLGIIEI